MNADIFIPARLDSTRLPKKQLKIINGVPIIKILIDRLRNAKKIRDIIVCTTTSKTDDELVLYLEKINVKYFRGSKKDILKRLLNAAEKFDTDIIINVEGDKIYTDPDFVDELVKNLEIPKIDFVMGQANEFDPAESIHGIIPSGFKVSALNKICQLKETNDTETGYIEFFTNTNYFNCKYIFPKIKIDIPKNLKLTLDYPEDLEFAEKIFNILGNNPKFEEIITLISKNPELIKIIELTSEKWNANYKKNITKISLNLKNDNGD